MPDCNLWTIISTFAAAGSTYFAWKTIDSGGKERRSRVAEEILKYVLKTEELLERIRDPRSKPGDCPKFKDPSAAASILEALNQHEPQKCVSLGIQAEKHLLKDTSQGCSPGEEIKKSLEKLRSILDEMRQCAYSLRAYP